MAQTADVTEPAHRRETPKIGGHAVVLGASMSRLLAARVLADAYQQVTVVERDPLPDSAADRKGVPQGWHAHGLLPRGGQILQAPSPTRPDPDQNRPGKKGN